MHLHRDLFQQRDAKAGKAAGRSGKRSIFGAKRSIAPHAKLGAQEATGQAGAGAERARQKSAPPGLPGLPEAESMLPKAALQELRRTALARWKSLSAYDLYLPFPALLVEKGTHAT